MEHITHTFHINNRTPRSHPNHSGNQPLRPTEVLMHQTPRNSLDMDQGASRGLHMLPKEGKVSIWGHFSLVFCLHLWDLCQFFRPIAQVTTKNSMTPSRMKFQIKTKIHLQKHHEGLDWTSTSHDRHFVKHITNMKSIGLNNRTEHRDIILI